MANPNGPYPGRQLFIGLTTEMKPCLVYLVTGRSPESRQRKAVQFENSVRIGPVENIAYDPLRHYTALKFDNCGVAAVSNGIQTEAVFETYRLMCNVAAAASAGYLESILEGAKAEPDSLHTPRIAGAVIAGRDGHSFFAGIKTFEVPASVRQFTGVSGKLSGISTYRGSLDTPEAGDPAVSPAEIKFNGKSASELAKYLYDISSADYKGDDIRVCAVAAVYSGTAWEIAIINKHK